MKLQILPLLVVLVLTSCSSRKIDSLQANIESIIRDKKASVGVGIYNITSNDLLLINGSDTFALMSVVKFHQALYILSLVDNGELSLNTKIHLIRDDLNPNSYSPILDEISDSSFSISLDEALSYTISKSDNNICDKLFELYGSPETVGAFINSNDLKNTQITTDYTHMRDMYANQTTPSDMIKLLTNFHNREILSKQSTEILWQKLTETSTGVNRLKGLLPENVTVGHKTGSSGRAPNGTTEIHNDIGIVELPNGEKIAIVVFIKDSQEEPSKNDLIIAKIAKMTYDFFMQN